MSLQDLELAVREGRADQELSIIAETRPGILLDPRLENLLKGSPGLLDSYVRLPLIDVNRCLTSMVLGHCSVARGQKAYLATVTEQGLLYRVYFIADGRLSLEFSQYLGAEDYFVFAESLASKGPVRRHIVSAFSVLRMAAPERLEGDLSAYAGRPEVYLNCSTQKYVLSAREAFDAGSVRCAAARPAESLIDRLYKSTDSYGRVSWYLLNSVGWVTRLPTSIVDAIPKALRGLVYKPNSEYVAGVDGPRGPIVLSDNGEVLVSRPTNVQVVTNYTGRYSVVKVGSDLAVQGPEGQFMVQLSPVVVESHSAWVNSRVGLKSVNLADVGYDSLILRHETGCYIIGLGYSPSSISSGAMPVWDLTLDTALVHGLSPETLLLPPRWDLARLI